MATMVPSRFAVLSIEDDDFKPKKSQKSVNNTKVTAKSKGDKPKPPPKKTDDKKKKQNKGKKKKSSNEEHQWEQWKQKDSEAVEETFNHELREAILLSKISYEAQLENTKSEPDVTKKSSNKKVKKSTMSLGEFNNMDNNAPQTVPTKVEVNCKAKVSDSEYFDRVAREATQLTSREVSKEKEKEILKARFEQDDENITSAQLRDEIEKRDLRIKELGTEVDSLKEELSQVKNRNKKLYQILSQGEMKDKASVLAEVSKLQDIRDELTLEVTSLHAQLEQERSKTRASSVDTKSSKQSNKKRLVNENA